MIEEEEQQEAVEPAAAEEHTEAIVPAAQEERAEAHGEPEDADDVPNEPSEYAQVCIRKALLLTRSY